jgi:acetyl-CoA carboxylase biotin carboxyl carrier protein
MKATERTRVALDSQPTWQDLLDLVADLTERDYDSVAVTFRDISVRLSRGGATAEPAPRFASPSRHAADAPTSGAPTPSQPITGPVITAPMLGVFYRRPSPGADPFVDVGQPVEPDTVVGIIEIMKLMNPVTAGITGVIAAFPIEDGTSVEFGQPLVELEPTAP